MGTSCPVTLTGLRSSMVARLCQGCAHSAHPQGLALRESSHHAIAIVLLWSFHSMHPALPCREISLPKNFSELARQDAHKDYLEQYRKQPGFLYKSCRWRNSGPQALVIGVDSEFGKNRTFTKNKCKHYRLFLI